MPERPEVEASNAVIIGTSQFATDLHPLWLTLGRHSPMCYIFFFIFDVACEPLAISLHVSALIGDFVYRYFVVTFWGHKTWVELIVQNMIDFNVILDID